VVPFYGTGRKQLLALSLHVLQLRIKGCRLVDGQLELTEDQLKLRRQQPIVLDTL